MNRIKGSMAVLLFCMGSTAVAQPQEEDMRAEMSFVLGLPQGAFERNLDETVLGAVTFFGGRVPGLPLVLGTELGFMNYGTDTHLELVRGPLPASVVSLETSNNIAMGHLVMRLQPPTGVVAPYVDALVGLKYFFTNTRIEGDFVLEDGSLVDLSDDELFAAASFNDYVFSYGAGGGIELQVFTGPMGWRDRPGTVSVNVGVRYLFGSPAKYLREGSFRQEGERVVFDVERSRTDMLVPQLGMRVQVPIE